MSQQELLKRHYLILPVNSGLPHTAHVHSWLPRASVVNSRRAISPAVKSRGILASCQLKSLVCWPHTRTPLTLRPKATRLVSAISAPDFRLVNHNGATMALSDFSGQVVVLTFMDSQCQEACPLTAVHLRAVCQALGDEASFVIFLGINVNSEANTVADVAAATQKWQLDEISTWHFLTGSPAELEPVWVAYNITVVPAPEADEELLHTPGVYLINQSGRLRWYVSPSLTKLGRLNGQPR